MQLTEDELAKVFVCVIGCGWMYDQAEFKAKLGVPADVATELWPAWSQLCRAASQVGAGNLARLIAASAKTVEATPKVQQP